MALRLSSPLATPLTSDDLLQDVDPTSKDFNDIASLWDLPCPIVKIQKVKNDRLWRRYEFIRSDVAAQVGEDNVNERHLWHGTSAATARSIAAEGFDHRVGVKHGRILGDGIYLTESTLLALRYGYGTNNYDRVSDFIERQAEALSPYGRDSQPWTEYHVTYGTDFNKDNVAIRTKFHAITMMKKYADVSFEELRMDDYEANGRGGLKAVPFSTTDDENLDVGYEDSPMDETFEPSRIGRFHCVEVLPELRGNSVEEIRLEDYRLNRRGIRPPFMTPVAENEEDDDDDQNMNDDSIAPISSGAKLKPRYESISLMPFYANQSFDELRVEDYKEGRKGRRFPRSSTPNSSAENKATSLFGPASKLTTTTGASMQAPNTRRCLFSFASQPSPNKKGVRFTFGGNVQPPTNNPSAFTLGGGSVHPLMDSRSPFDCGYMIFARVTLGLSTPGHKDLKRPPPISEGDLTKGRFNSCTGKFLDQNVFVVFDNAQVYPEYIVQFRLDEKLLADS